MYHKIMNYMKLVENQARKSNNHANLKRLAKHSSNVATFAANLLNNSAQLTAIRRRAANIRRYEVNHRLGRRRLIGRFTVTN